MDGIYVASMVLFDDEGKINKEESKKLLDRNLAEGAAGFFPYHFLQGLLT